MLTIDGAISAALFHDFFYEKKEICNLILKTNFAFIAHVAVIGLFLKSSPNITFKNGNPLLLLHKTVIKAVIHYAAGLMFVL